MSRKVAAAAAVFAAVLMSTGVAQAQATSVEFNPMYAPNGAVSSVFLTYDRGSASLDVAIDMWEAQNPRSLIAECFRVSRNPDVGMWHCNIDTQ